MVPSAVVRVAVREGGRNRRQRHFRCRQSKGWQLTHGTAHLAHSCRGCIAGPSKVGSLGYALYGRRPGAVCLRMNAWQSALGASVDICAFVDMSTCQSAIWLQGTRGPLPKAGFGESTTASLTADGERWSQEHLAVVVDADDKRLVAVTAMPVLGHKLFVVTVHIRPGAVASAAHHTCMQHAAGHAARRHVHAAHLGFPALSTGRSLRSGGCPAEARKERGRLAARLAQDRPPAVVGTVHTTIAMRHSPPALACRHRSGLTDFECGALHPRTRTASSAARHQPCLSQTQVCGQERAQTHNNVPCREQTTQQLGPHCAVIYQ